MGTTETRRAHLNELAELIHARDEITEMELLGLVQMRWAITDQTFQGYTSTLIRAGLINRVNQYYSEPLKRWVPTTYRANK